MNKRFFVAVLALCLTLSLLTPAAYAATTPHDINAGSITISASGDYRITGTGTSTANTITVATGVTANITLENVKIDTDAGPAMDLDGATVTLTLNGANALKTTHYPSAGLHVPDGAELTITEASTGSLDVTGGDDGAGIGGGSGGTITINGGTVTATSKNGAGIGGGYGSSTGGSGGTVTINGGAVTATSGRGAGIGGGGGSFIRGGSGGTVTIRGGTVTATSTDGAGIGGGGSIDGDGGNGGDVKITGGTVTATSTNGAGIGGGRSDRNLGHGTPGTFTADGNAFIDARGIGDNDDKSGWKGVIFDGANGAIYGTSVTLQTSATVPAGKTLTVAKNQTLVVNTGVTLTNSGTIENKGTIIKGGTITGGGSWSGAVAIDHPTSYDITTGNSNIYINGTYTITGGTSAVPATNTITVATGVTANITLDNVNINNTVGPAMNLEGATVTLTLEGANTLKSTQDESAGLHVPSGATLTITQASTGSLNATGKLGAGIGGGDGGSGGTITINGGTVNATSTAYGAGIGGGYGSSTGSGSGTGGSGGTITINGGTVTATATERGAGIGGGGGNSTGGSGGTITIRGGTVTVTGTGTGIGGGKNGSDHVGDQGSFTADGNAFIDASGIGHQGNKANWKGVIFQGSTGKIYGTSVTLKTSATVPATKTLTIADGETLAIDTGVTLTNSGTIYNSGTITGAISGTQPIVPTGNLDITTGSIEIATGWYKQANGVQIPYSGSYVITGGTSAAPANNTITVATGVTANITLKNVNIEATTGPAMDLEGATVTLTLEGANMLKTTDDYSAGLQVPDGATLTITGAASADSLEAIGGIGGAGIGGGSDSTAGTITINGGTVTATGGTGIGGGYSSDGGSGGTVTIHGGTVNATGNNGAGIGGAYGDMSGGSGGTVKITGGTVTATSTYSAGIGGGYSGGYGGVGGNVTITGGNVTATSTYGAGIGGGYGDSNGGSGGTVKITGGTVTATSTAATGIGGGGGGTIDDLGAPGTFTADGNAFIDAKSIGDNDDKSGWNGVIFDGSTGKIYGTSVTLKTSATVASGKTLTIQTAETLVVDTGVTLTNRGTIYNSGTFTGTGTLVGNKANYLTAPAAPTLSGTPGTTSVTLHTVPGQAYAVTTTATPPMDIDYTTTTARVGEFQTGYGGAKAVDNDTATCWHTIWNQAALKDNQWITIDLGSSKQVFGLRYLPQTASTNGTVTEYRVEVSTNDTDWTVVSTGSWAETGDWKLASFSQVTARYVKLFGVKTIGTSPLELDHYMSAAEIRVITPATGWVTATGSTMTLDSLTANTQYHFWTYKPEDSFHYGSPPSTALMATTAPTPPPVTGSSDGPSAVDKATSALQKAKDGDTVKLDLGTGGKLPGTVLDALAGKNVTLEIKVGNVTWVIQGKDVPTGNRFSALNLSVNPKGKSIPVTVLNTLTGEHKVMQLSLSHDGPFGFKLTLLLDAGKENAGLWANLYYYNPTTKALEFRTSAKIDESGVSPLAFTGASDYAVVIDTKNLGALPFTDVAEDAWYHDAVRYVYENGLFSGTTETTFNPDAPMTRAMLWTVLARQAGQDMTGADPWYAKAQAWAVSKAISDGTNPSGNITREQLVTTLYRNAGSPEATGDLSGFTDAASISAYAKDAMSWAVATGILSGDGGKLMPQGNATRAQVAAILSRMATSAK